MKLLIVKPLIVMTINIAMIQRCMLMIIGLVLQNYVVEKTIWQLKMIY